MVFLICYFFLHPKKIILSHEEPPLTLIKSKKESSLFSNPNIGSRSWTAIPCTQVRCPGEGPGGTLPPTFHLSTSKQLPVTYASFTSWDLPSCLPLRLAPLSPMLLIHLWGSPCLWSSLLSSFFSSFMTIAKTLRGERSPRLPGSGCLCTSAAPLVAPEVCGETVSECHTPG